MRGAVDDESCLKGVSFEEITPVPLTRKATSGCWPARTDTDYLLAINQMESLDVLFNMYDTDKNPPFTITQESKTPC